MLAGEELVKAAQSTAEVAHRGQVDRSGAPYLGHPRRVAETLQSQGYSADIIAAGWLHDVIEDTEVTADDLLAAGFPSDVVSAVVALSHFPEESLEEYLGKVRLNEMAIPVKLADLADNTDPKRLDHLPDQTRERLKRKYARSYQLLGR